MSYEDVMLLPYSRRQRVINWKQERIAEENRKLEEASRRR